MNARHPWFSGLPDHYVVAHRGGAGVRPENTLSAFQQAAEQPVQAIELDIHLSRDGHLMVAHDDSIERMTNGTGRIADCTRAELEQWDAGYFFSPDKGKTFPFRDRGCRIPALEDVVDAFPHLRWVVEIKPAALATTEALVAWLERRELADRLLICSFHDHCLHAFRSQRPGYATGAGQRETSAFIRAVWKGNAESTSWPFHALTVPRRHRIFPVVTARSVRAARACGLQVQVWTVNNPGVMQRLYRLGAHAMTTDFPDRAVQVLQRLHSEAPA